MSDNKVYHQYFSTRPIMNIATTTGKMIHFVGSTYVTDAEDEIAFLDNEIRAGLKAIYVKQDKKTVSAVELDPLAAIKKKVIDEYLAAQAAQADVSRDMGNTSTDPQAGMQTSKSIGAITVGSNVSAKK